MFFVQIYSQLLMCIFRFK